MCCVFRAPSGSPTGPSSVTLGSVPRAAQAGHLSQGQPPCPVQGTAAQGCATWVCPEVTWGLVRPDPRPHLPSQRLREAAIVTRPQVKLLVPGPGCLHWLGIQTRTVGSGLRALPPRGLESLLC